MTLLAGKRLLATGVLTEQSLASAVVRTALEQGAEVLLTSPACRGLSVTSRVAPRLGVHTKVLELDVTLPRDLVRLEQAVREAGWAGTPATPRPWPGPSWPCSDWFPATTGEVVDVDGGAHSIGAALPSGTGGGRAVATAATEQDGCSDASAEAEDYAPGQLRRCTGTGTPRRRHGGGAAYATREP